MATAAGTQNGIVMEAAEVPNLIMTAAAGYPLIKTFRGKEWEDVERFLKNVARYICWKSFSALDVWGLLELRRWCYRGNDVAKRVA